MSRPVQELDLVPVGKLVAVMAATVVLTLGCLLWVWLVMKPFERASRGTQAPLRAIRAEVGGPAAVPVDQTLFSERQAYSAARVDRQRQLLDSYGYVDKAKGLVRIPVARAMEILAGEGK
jgi:hypothetical protein